MISPDDIKKEIQNASPYQRTAVMSSYEDIKVSWKLQFYTIIFSKLDKTAQVMCKSESTYPWVYVSLDSIENYPEFKIMKEGATFRVDGLIGSVSGIHDITLKECSFIFSGSEENQYSNGRTGEPLKRKIETKRTTFSMDNPVIYFLIAVILFFFYHFIDKLLK